MLRIDFIQNLPKEVPSSLRLFSLEKAPVDRVLIVKVLSGLGPRANPSGFRWSNKGGWMTGVSKDVRVSINQSSGAIRFWTRWNDREFPKTRFSIEEPRLESIARDFLKKSGFSETPVDSLRVRKIAYLRLQTGTTKGTVNTPKILDAGVIFGREVDGVPVSGPGGYMMINVGPDETVVAGTKVWRRLGANVGTAQILGPGYALDELNRKLRSQKIDQPVRVVKSEFCYFEKGENDEQNYLEPAYAFILEYETRQNQFPSKTAIVIPAIQRSRQNWNPQQRFS